MAEDAVVDFADDIARQVIRLLTDKALYSKLSENGKKLVTEKYSWDVIAERMHIVMKNLCAS